MWTVSCVSCHSESIRLGQTAESTAIAELHGAIERLGQIRDQIVRILDADRVANQVVLDAHLQALLSRELVEAHDRRLLDEALHAAERGCDVGNRARVD